MIWKPIGDWPYEASEDGQIRRSRPGKGSRVGKILKQTICDGRALVFLIDGARKWSTAASRVICTAFHGPAPTPQHEADHIDYDPLNNRPDNLQWLTRLENLARRRHRTGESNPGCKLTDRQVLQIIAVPYVKGLYARQGREYSVEPSHIRSLHLGLKRKTASLAA